MIHAALDGGINFIDSADIYSSGDAEMIVGQALRGKRDHVVLATKVGGPAGDDVNQRGSSRRWLMQSIDGCLDRLCTDRIDLLQLHRPDPDSCIEETLGALTDLQRAGKIRYFGTSAVAATQIVENQWASARNGLGRFVTEQPPYSMLFRGIESEILPTCQQYGLGVLTWSPLAGGWLSGKYRIGAVAPGNSRSSWAGDRYDASHPSNAGKLDATERLFDIANAAGLSLIHLSLAFVLSHPAISSAIIGPRTMEQLESQTGAADLVLSNEILDLIDLTVAPGVSLSDGPDAGWRSPALTSATLRRRTSLPPEAATTLNLPPKSSTWERPALEAMHDDDRNS